MFDLLLFSMLWTAALTEKNQIEDIIFGEGNSSLLRYKYPLQIQLIT